MDFIHICMKIQLSISKGLLFLSLTARTWKVTVQSISDNAPQKFELEFADVRSITGEYWEVSEEWFQTFYQKVQTKHISLAETFSIERVDNPEGEESNDTYISILCSSKQEPALGWLIVRMDPDEDGVLVGISPESYTNKIRDNSGHLNLLVEFINRPANFRDVSAGITP